MQRRDFVAGVLATTTIPSLWHPRSIIQQGTPIRVNGERLNAQLAELAQFGRTATGTNRVAYTDADVAGRHYVRQLMREAGLEVRVDPAGNIFGRREGREPGRPVILFGSHIDSVPDGGNYDGDVGSLGAIEVARTLMERKVTTRHPFEVVVFQNEEGGTVGSRLMAAGMTDAELDRTARSGKTIREGIGIVGGNVARLSEARRKTGDLLCYFELHIEQGGTLDETGIQIGVVEGIVGLRWFEVTIEGFANHAGTTPMNRRKDAMLAAARITMMVNQVVRSIPGSQVGTVGRISAVPGTVNVIPGRVLLTIDLRDLSTEKLTQLSGRFHEEARTIASETGTAITLRETSTNEPALADLRVRSLIVDSARALGLSQRDLPSFAGHDAQEVARIAPMGMIFIPSVGGISHSPQEFSRPGDITHGANVLMGAVLAADSKGLGT